MQSAEAINSADAWLSSRDYGGYGFVTATATVNGVTINATVIGTGGPMAPIPIDANGDYIADAWENTLGVPLPLNPSADGEVNAYGAPAGDGFSAFEEYRGFIVINSGENSPNCVIGAVCHIRTNPVTQQDVFVVDTNSLFTSFGGILKAATPFAYHVLSLELGNPKAVTDASAGLNFLRRDFTNISNADRPVFALDILSRAIDDPGTLGTSNGLSNNGLPVLLDLSHIHDAFVSNTAIPENVITMQVLAHEVGHKFGLIHYTDRRPVEPTLTSTGITFTDLAANPGRLPANRYGPCYSSAEQPCYAGTAENDRFYVWHDVARRADGTPYRLGAILQPQTGDLAGLPPYIGDANSDAGILPVLADTPTTAANIFMYTLYASSDGSVKVRLNQPLSFIDIWVFLLEIMDQTPVQIPILAPAGAWHFDAVRDLPKMCLRPSCQ
jgi:hypothetical protein